MSLDMADVKPSVISFLTVGIMALLFLTLGKYLTAKYNIPGISAIFAAA